MSTIYNLEPFTSGKVIIHTTYGDLEIELWSKETPKTCRNFIQLCLEGYYDDMIFHRVIKDFIIQTGDPTGTGKGGESIYGQPFEDELTTRLRYTRRGLIGMANTGKNLNTSQFFITLDKTPELQNKNTLFGRIVGDTIYNAARIGQVETDKNERPTYPPKITSIEIISNPFTDIVPRITPEERKKVKEEKKEEIKKAQEGKNRKQKPPPRNKLLLSFGDEEDVNENSVQVKIKAKSVHDIADANERLSKEVSEEDLLRSRASVQEDVTERLTKLKKEKAGNKIATEVDIKERIRRDIEATKEARKSNIDSKLKSHNTQFEIEKLHGEIKSLHKRSISEKDTKSESSQTIKKLKKDNALEKELEKYKEKSRLLRIKKSRTGAKDTAAMLAEFQSKLDKEPDEMERINVTQPEKDDDDNDDEESEPCLLHGVYDCLSCHDTFGKEDNIDYSDWMSHTLKFDKERAGRDHLKKLQEYEVIDTREERNNGRELLKSRPFRR